MSEAIEPPALPQFLRTQTVLAIHRAQIAEHGGDPGIRDQGLLESALAQPGAQFGGEYLHADLFLMAAAYVFHLANNHPFVDGNKRTALAAALVFLDMNGYEIADEGTDLADLVIELITQRRDKSWIAEQLRQRARAFANNSAVQCRLTFLRLTRSCGDLSEPRRLRRGPLLLITPKGGVAQ